MSETYIGALDAGTTSTRFMIFDHQGQVVSMAQRPHAQIFPDQGWVEHDPEELWLNSVGVIRDALAQAELSPTALAAIGIANQRETTIVWERETGTPVYNAIVWQDIRTASLCGAWERAGLGEDITRITGLLIAPYFAASKIRWILDHIENGQTLAETGRLCFGTVDSWLLWKLTGGQRHVTDVTNASRTMFMDLETLSWDAGLLEAMRIPRALLPTIASSSDRDAFGATAADGPLGHAVPIMGVLGDQQAATVGQTCFRPGEAKNTYGTGCFLMLNTGPQIVRSHHGLLTTVAYRFGQAPTVYALEGSIAMGGATVQWLRDELELISTPTETEALAASVSDNGGCYLVPAFSGLFAPHWRSDARGVIVGLTRYVTKAHLVRAALEAICHQSREVLEAMHEDSGIPLDILRVDGGATANAFLMQLQADLLGTPVVKPVLAETTSLGAAFAAGLAVGYWADEREIARRYTPDRSWRPQSSAQYRRAEAAQWSKAVQRTLDWSP